MTRANDSSWRPLARTARKLPRGSTLRADAGAVHRPRPGRGVSGVIALLLLSGFIYPIANMPAAVRAVTYLNPLRYFLIVVRGIFLKGVGVEVLWPRLAALALLGLAALTLAVLRFRKTLS